MKKLLFLALVLSITAGSCSLFEKEQLGKSALERKADSLHKADSIRDLKAKALKAKEKKLREDSLRKAQEEKEQRINAKYQIIAGSFKVNGNATSYNEAMKKLGYDAIIIPGEYRFNLVSINGFDDMQTAVSELRRLKSSTQTHEELWVYVQSN